MRNKQMQHLMRNSKAMMDFQMTGRLPRAQAPSSSPLIALLELLPPRLRQELRGIKVHPKLGYNTCHQFNNAEQLLNWLKPSQQFYGNQSHPAESLRIKHFSSPLTLGDLKPYCASWPSDEVFNYYGISVDA